MRKRITRRDISMQKIVRFATWGPVRGSCGHLHQTQETAERCADADRRACHIHGGYSDRVVRRIEGDTLAAIRASLRRGY